MKALCSSSLACALMVGAGTAPLAPSSAFAHAVCGARVFPATLAIDDPGVGDELALPTLTWLPHNSDGAREFDASFAYTKTIFPHFGLSVSDGPTWLEPGGRGWGDIDTEAKYNFFCVPDAEFMGSVGLDMTWAHTGTANMTNPFNSYTPTLDLGKGFGDLPTSLNVLRPFAVTAELSETVPGQAWTDGSQNPTSFNWGFTVQYSLPYYNSSVSQIDSDFLRRLVLLTEFAFSKPVSNFAPGTDQTTGTIQPGVMYMGDTYQVSLEAVLPINAASGHGVGLVGELHFFLDDIFPNSIGKPLFQ